MTIDELKTAIEQRTGVPASLLTGDDEAAILAQAKDLVNFRMAKTAEPETNADRFAALFAGEDERDPGTNPASLALDELAEAVRLDKGGYPNMHDGGEVGDLPDPRSTRDKFAEWFGQVSAFRL